MIVPNPANTPGRSFLTPQARITADECGYDDLAQVIREADDTEALPVMTPSIVVTRIEQGLDPQDVVVGLVREAMTATDGLVPDPQRPGTQLSVPHETMGCAPEQWHTVRDQPGKVAEMPAGDVETYFEDDQWKNKVEGGRRASNTAATKAEAQAKGREMAMDRGVEHIIRNKDGEIGARNTYPRSRDPRSSRG